MWVCVCVHSGSLPYRHSHFYPKIYVQEYWQKLFVWWQRKKSKQAKYPSFGYVNKLWNTLLLEYMSKGIKIIEKFGITDTSTYESLSQTKISIRSQTTSQ